MESGKTLFRIAVSCLSRAALMPLCLLPVRKNRVLFVSYRGKQYSCNPRAISEKLREIAGDKLEIAWAFHEPEKFSCLKDEGITVLDDRSRAFLRYALTARVVCTNAYYKPFLPRRRGQFYLRTWHGGGAYKRVGRFEKMPLLQRLYVNMQQQGADLYLSSSEAFTRLTLREAFGYRGEVLEKGMPRNDALVNGSSAPAARAKKALGVPEGGKLALYAPTYRDDARAREFQFDFERAKKALSARFGGEWVFAFRGHHVVTEDKSRATSADIDCTDYPDMQDLLSAADALFTDYSSCIWDMSLTFKPAFLYAPDLSVYQSERDFFTDIRSWPFPLSQSNGELERNILDFDEEKYRADVKRHHEELGSFETGNASELAARRIMKECGIGERPPKMKGEKRA